MRSHLSFVALPALSLLLPNITVYARRGLDPEDIHLLTRGTDYTFHSICADYKNPDLFFYEWVPTFPSLSSLLISFLFLFLFFSQLPCNLDSISVSFCLSRMSHRSGGEKKNNNKKTHVSPPLPRNSPAPSTPSQTTSTCTCRASPPHQHQKPRT